MALYPSFSLSRLLLLLYVHPVAWTERRRRCTRVIDCDAHFICMLSIIKFLPMWMWHMNVNELLLLYVCASVHTAIEQHAQSTHLPAFELVKPSTFCFYLFFYSFWWSHLQQYIFIFWSSSVLLNLINYVHSWLSLSLSFSHTCDYAPWWFQHAYTFNI